MPENKYPGDANRITREYIDSLLIEMRHIGAVAPDTGFTLFGHRFDTPVATAALSHLKGLEGSGMVQMAAACAQVNAPCFAGMGDEEELGQMVATGARVIKIIKPYADRSMITRRLEAARDLGALAVGMDLDHTFDGLGQPDVVLGHEMAPYSEASLRALIHQAGLPFVIKGVLSVTDAQKALALGADAPCIGRALMPALEQEGTEGAANVLSRITGQLKGAMARTACATLGDLEPGLIRSV